MRVVVTGGEYEDFGQFVSCLLEDSSHSFDFNTNREAISVLRKLSQQTGRQEISDEEGWKRYFERERVRKMKGI